jgi:penicillin V acylase-like amidase (Ntn superfamily)
MRQGTRCKVPASFALSLPLLLLSISLSLACTRIVYLGAAGNIVTARSMDWNNDIGTNLWILPRGMMRTGQTGPNTVK